MKVEKESGESQRIRSQLAGLCRRGGLAFLSKSSKPVGASTVDSSSEESDSEEKNKPKPKSKANSKEKATPKTAAKPKVPQKRKELIEKKSSEGRRRWKTEAAQPTAEPPKQMEAAKASEPSANPGRNPADKAERSKGSKQAEKLGAKPAEKRAANSEKNEEISIDDISEGDNISVTFAEDGTVESIVVLSDMNGGPGGNSRGCGIGSAPRNRRTRHRNSCTC